MQTKKGELSMKYKPQTIEENLANIVWMRNNFYPIIDSYISQYNCLNQIYSNPFTFNAALGIGVISPYTNYEIEISKMTYSIFGFLNDVYNRISYGLDCWNRHSNKIKAGASTENYDNLIRVLKSKKVITGVEKASLLRFRPVRNYSTHYGKIIFSDYLFRNAGLLYQILISIENLLRANSFDNQNYLNYLNSQSNFIQDLQNTMSDFAVTNNLTVVA